ncbi:MAG TPA: UDP-glucose/GDP-mannose dehydrogenase family protein [Acidiphilium sp.]|nr:MAG: UDP-glucose 6-dehydrogenase [Acidiphilium sp. 21-60-14]OYV89777.1 MAG: UDP-glucose 6-dehydrogenase [Acidiphilium sp. 37-60-79]OZB39795.1 MAG: UDP-glucose 6-dehydrogenase [Acidiphilium sp. 34-60-192]HQT89506.1 UDP-glucose/GDP-mannose dehydrogenase family protein [Acidiphilium sp.]HQU24816.1 UDP-glucose/GDP-mannose dehydrogenase family protein [Acidiphilium sp.]
MRIAMIGGGYVGLVSGACFAALGATVVIVEADEHRFNALRDGRIPIYEPGLEELVSIHRAAGRLHFVNTIDEAVDGVDAVFLAVGTPSRRGDGHADLSYVFDAVDQLAGALTGPAILVTKSTVPVGTGARIATMMASLRPDLAIEVASNPEFLREGSAISDFMRPDRVVIGANGACARAVLSALYQPLTQQGVTLLFTGLETAELIKYAANSFLAMKISFINEMADLCEKLGADVTQLAHGMGLDHRIGAQFLHAGPGFGGSCFPKDTQALVRIAQDAGAPTRLVETVVAVNEARKAAMTGRVIAACGGSVRGRRIAVLGLTFKPDTDDMRDAPAIGIIHRLVDEGAIITAYDPMGMDHARFQLPARVTFCADAQSALRGADAAVLITEWAEFRALTPADLCAALRGRTVIDLRNIFDPTAMQAAGIAYYGIGRPQPPAINQRDRRAQTPYREPRRERSLSVL